MDDHKELEPGDRVIFAVRDMPVVNIYLGVIMIIATVPAGTRGRYREWPLFPGGNLVVEVHYPGLKSNIGFIGEVRPHHIVHDNFANRLLYPNPGKGSITEFGVLQKQSFSP